MATRKKRIQMRANKSRAPAKKSAQAVNGARSRQSTAKVAAKKPSAKTANGNALPRPSAMPWGEAGRALDGVRILDFTHVQSGPTCTQLLAFMGADVIKVERPGVGDITRGQLRDVKGADSLYFTMLNGNKRSITIDTKHPKGKEILDRLVQGMRRAGGEFRARRARPHGAHLGAHPQAQSAHDRRVGQGLRPRTVRRLQGLRERRAMRRRFGIDHRLSRRPAARDRRADRRFRHRPASGARHRRRALPAQPHRPRAEGALRHAGRRAQSGAREAARPAAARARPAHRIQPIRRGRFRSATRCRARATIPAAASPAGSSNARARRAIPTPTSISSPRRRCGARSAT